MSDTKKVSVNKQDLNKMLLEFYKKQHGIVNFKLFVDNIKIIEDENNFITFEVYENISS